MRKTNLITIIGTALLSGFALVSCNKKLSSIPVQEVQDKHFVDALSDSYTYLVLDDSSVDAILGEITEVLVDDDLIFISHIPHAGGSYLTDQELSVYDKNGKYLRRIGRKGRAQNEYLYLTSWALDKANKEVYMFDRSTSVIKKFSYQGEYISKIDLSDETSACAGTSLICDAGITLDCVPRNRPGRFLYCSKKLCLSCLESNFLICYNPFACLSRMLTGKGAV